MQNPDVKHSQGYIRQFKRLNPIIQCNRCKTQAQTPDTKLLIFQTQTPTPKNSQCYIRQTPVQTQNAKKVQYTNESNVNSTPKANLNATIEFIEDTKQKACTSVWHIKRFDVWRLAFGRQLSARSLKIPGVWRLAFDCLLGFRINSIRVLKWREWP